MTQKRGMSMCIDENLYEVESRDIYKKSRFLISTVYKSTLMENRVLALAFSNIDKAYEDKEGSIIVEMNTNYIKDKFGITGRSIYNNLDNVASRLMYGRSIGFSDPQKCSFSYVPLITKASYEEGVFTLRFPPEMKQYIKDLQGNFTLLSLETMLSFDSVYSFRLYEILKSKAYMDKGHSQSDYKGFKIQMSVSELKLELGVVNSELEKVRRVLLNTKNGVPDYDKAVEVADEKMYSRYNKFKEVCITPAVEEINSKTDMNVTFEPVRVGKGGKTKALIFYVEFNKASDKDEIVEVKKPNEDDFIDNMFNVISKKIKISEARILAQIAGYNLDTIVKADEYVMKKKYDDYAAYMVETIKNKWYEQYYEVKEPKIKQKTRSLSEIEEMLSGENIKLDEAI